MEIPTSLKVIDSTISCQPPDTAVMSYATMICCDIEIHGGGGGLFVAVTKQPFTKTLTLILFPPMLVIIIPQQAVLSPICLPCVNGRYLVPQPQIVVSNPCRDNIPHSSEFDAGAAADPGREDDSDNSGPLLRCSATFTWIRQHLASSL